MKHNVSQKEDIDCPVSWNTDQLHHAFFSWHKYKSDFIHSLSGKNSDQGISFR